MESFSSSSGIRAFLKFKLLKSLSISDKSCAIKIFIKKLLIAQIIAYLIDIKKELSVMVGSRESGEIVVYPAVEMEFNKKSVSINENKWKYQWIINWDQWTRLSKAGEDQ